MDDKTHFRQLLRRYLADELSAKEEDLFFDLLQDPSLFSELEVMIDGKLKDFNGSERTINDRRLSDIEYRILSGSRKRADRIKFVWIRMVAAAAVLVFIAFSLKLYTSTQKLPIPDIAEVAHHNQSKLTDIPSMEVIGMEVQGDYRFREKPSEITAIQDSLLHFSNPKTGRGQRYTTIYVPSGKLQEIILPDQSKAWLNADSYLTFSTDMNGAHREVYLDGEGYFDIKTNGSGFTVRTRAGSISVLGTSFNVNSYESESTFAVELLTGKIQLTSNDGTFSPIAMYPGEKVVYHKNTKQIEIDRHASGEDILWTKKQIALKHTTLDELFAKLERFYNVRIHADEGIKTREVSYSGRLSLEADVLVTLQSIYELKDYDLQINDKEVYIIEKNRNNR